MKEINLGIVQTKNFEDFLIIGLSKNWIYANDEKPIVFHARLSPDGKLVLTGTLSNLSNTRDVINCEM